MKFTALHISGVFVVDLERRADERGFFARSWCAREFADHGISSSIEQINVSHTLRAGTIRGMHLQTSPHMEVKVVSCTRGAIYDVAVDLRPWSTTYREWIGVELSADNRRMLVIPEGCAHGFQSICDDVEIQYLASRAYAPTHATGVRYDDPAFSISWPLPVSVISPGDLNWALLADAEPMDLRPTVPA